MRLAGEVRRYGIRPAVSSDYFVWGVLTGALGALEASPAACCWLVCGVAGWAGLLDLSWLFSFLWSDMILTFVHTEKIFRSVDMVSVARITSTWTKYNIQNKT
jgi:hypothetical protein